MSIQEIPIRSHPFFSNPFHTVPDLHQPCQPPTQPFHCTDRILTRQAYHILTPSDPQSFIPMFSAGLLSADNFQEYMSGSPYMHPQTCSVEQHRGPSINPNLLANNLFRNDQASHSMSLQTKAISTFQDVDLENQLLPEIELDYSMLDSAMRRSAPINHANSTDRGSTADRLNANSVATADGVDAVETEPLLESEFYFGDILGDNGVAPDGLASMVKADETDDGEPGISKDYQAQHCNFFSAETAITNEELSNHSSKLENTFSAGLSSPYENPYCSVTPAEINAQRSSCQQEKKDHGGHSVSVSSSDHATGINADHISLEPGNSEAKVHITHSLSDYDKFNIDEGYDENEDGNVLSSSPHSGTSMTNEQGYGTHPDLYENLSAKIQKHVDALREKIAAMPRRKLRESLAQSVTLEDVEPLMFINRDELAGMLGVGVTTWKTFMHSLGVPRWPARMLKSQKVKEEKLIEKREEAEKRGDRELVDRLTRDLAKLRNANSRRRKQLRTNAQFRVANVMIKKE